MVRAGCVFVAGIHPSRTWTSGSFESVRWNACVHRLDLGLYSHPKEFWGNGVWTHVNSKGKIPSTGKCPQRSIEPATLWQRAQVLPTELFQPLIESKTSVVQTSNDCFTSEVSDYLVVHTGPGPCQDSHLWTNFECTDMIWRRKGESWDRTRVRRSQSRPLGQQDGPSPPDHRDSRETTKL